MRILLGVSVILMFIGMVIPLFLPKHGSNQGLSKPPPFVRNPAEEKLEQMLRQQEQTNFDANLPTGKLAFVTSLNFGMPGKIVVLSNHQRNTTLAYETRDLEFLPDGNRIIYGANDAQANGIYIYDLTQHTNILLIPKVLSETEPSLSPDGRRIAFVQDRENSSQIFTANLDGTHPRQLTDGQSYNWTPRWSPDGRQLLFETTRNDTPATHGNGGHRDIYVMAANGQDQMNLTTNGYGHHASWSPDGKSIAYMNHGKIYVMKSDGSARQNISQGKTRDSEPAWSPDGQWIAFSRTANNPPDPETMNIWIMKSDGTQPRPLTFNQGDASSFSPSWGQ